MSDCLADQGLQGDAHGQMEEDVGEGNEKDDDEDEQMEINGRYEEIKSNVRCEEI